jgi:prepilin-type N-terminal cleavage/methylation domain-containing protein
LAVVRKAFPSVVKVPGTGLGSARPGARGTAGWEQRGFTLVEALIAAFVVGIAAVATAMMFGTAQNFVHAEGDNRVAFYVAQQRMEQIRSTGFGSTTLPDAREETAGIGVQIDNFSDTDAVPGFRRQTLITGVCPTDYSVAWNSGGCPTSGVLLAKLVTVSVRVLDGPTSFTDPVTQPVVIQAVLVKR